MSMAWAGSRRLYYEQWRKLLEAAEELGTFLDENKSRLKLKEEA